MKYLMNIALLGMIFLGIAMAADTPWGFGVVLIPFVIWGTQLLVLVHKSIWSTVVFWGGIAYFQWQVTVVVGVVYLVVWIARKIVTADKEVVYRRRQKRKKYQLSPIRDYKCHLGYKEE